MVLAVPYVPTPQPVVRRMLEAACVRPREVVYDLGAGDGRIVLTAVEEFGANAVGVEIHPERVRTIRSRLRRLEDVARVIHGNFYSVCLRDADVVTMYLTPRAIRRLVPKLERELKGGALVVSHDYRVPGWRPDNIEVSRDSGGTHYIYLYTMPAAPAGLRRLRLTGVP